MSVPYTSWIDYTAEVKTVWNHTFTPPTPKIFIGSCLIEHKDITLFIRYPVTVVGTESCKSKRCAQTNLSRISNEKAVLLRDKKQRAGHVSRVVTRCTTAPCRSQDKHESESCAVQLLCCSSFKSRRTCRTDKCPLFKLVICVTWVSSVPPDECRGTDVERRQHDGVVPSISTFSSHLRLGLRTGVFPRFFKQHFIYFSHTCYVSHKTP
jgi:hypothetical protein